MWLDYRMRPDKAIVYVGITPPECEYFSYIEYIALRYSEELSTYHRIFTSLGDSISLSRLQSEPAYKTNFFSEPIIIIFTADKVADQNAREALMNAGYPEEIMHTLVIPKDLVCMGLVAESDTFSTLSRIALFKDQSEEENFINSTPGIVYRLTPTIEGEPDYYIPDSAIFLIDSMLKIYDNLQVEIKRIEERIKFYLKDKDNELRILMSVPEIGIVIGSNLLAEIGDIHDFPTADKLAKWAGLTPSVYQSANTNYTGSSRNMVPIIFDGLLLKLHTLRLEDQGN